MKKEKSCGCIIIKNDQVLLIKEKNGNFWGFPKGHMENNENEIQTALRETFEEVGLNVLINENKRYELYYIVNNDIDKTVVLYMASPKNDNIIIQESEISDVKWLPIDKATELLTYDNLKEILIKVKNELKVNQKKTIDKKRIIFTALLIILQIMIILVFLKNF